MGEPQRTLSAVERELDALHAATRLLRDDGLPLEILLDRLVALLPGAFRHDGDASARIVFGLASRATKGFAETPWLLRSSFATSEGLEGRLEVAYARAHEAADEGPFLAGERRLLDALAESLRAEIERRRIASHLQTLVGTGRVRLFVLDVATDIVHFPGLFDPFAEGKGIILRWPREKVLGFLHAEDRDRVLRTVEAAVAAPPGKDGFTAEYRIGFPDPPYEWRHLEGKVVRDAAGAVLRILGISFSIDRERALQEQLRQAQKMEALGRLAGSVAHDFNNILTAILGYSELAAAALPPDHAARPHLEEVGNAGLAASDLVRQILAFARRQELRPRKVDLGKTIQGMRGMLASLLGSPIRLDIEAAPDAPAPLVDPGQFQQVVLNLSLNARDAMPKGGTVTMRVLPRTAGAPGADGAPGAPKPWVALEVRDTGSGIPPEVRDRIFEPFFTTKGEGKGTGLGLPTVHGIVAQSGGFLEFESEVGRGTLFRAMFPVAP